MRFCPFCSAENADELAACTGCGRRLPPLPPRRTRDAPATGVNLPPRTPSSTQPPPLPRRPTGTTLPPPLPTAAPKPAPVADHPNAQSGLLPIQPGVMVSPGAMTAPPGSHAALPVPPPPADDGRRALLNALSPGPAAVRREAAVPEPRGGDPRARRISDQPLSPTALPRPRPGTPSTPPPSPPGRGATSFPPVPARAFEDDFNTSIEAEPIEVEAIKPRTHATGVEPPDTRIHRPEALADRPFTPPKVNPVPVVPEPGLYNAARYAVWFGHARFQRRGAIRTLQAEIKQDTDALDQVLGALGRVARGARVDGRVFSAENTAINAAEERIAVLAKEHAEVDARKAEENSRFDDVERERNAKLTEAERTVDEVQLELGQLDGQRRGARDKRKELERRSRAYLKSAEDSERQAGSVQMGDARGDLRRSAEQMRKEAATLDSERQEVDRRLAGLERPIGEATAKLDAAKAELDAAKRSLSDAREGHNHRLAELDGEQKRKTREIAQAESEVSRRLVTLGTLVNLNRIDDPQFGELYQRIDRLRGAITARTTEIEKLTAEREAYDRGTLVRGLSAMGGAIVVLIALIVILRALL